MRVFTCVIARVKAYGYRERERERGAEKCELKVHLSHVYSSATQRDTIIACMVITNTIISHHQYHHKH